MPVRDPEFWRQASVKQALEETLMFLSGDRFEFSFLAKDEPEAERSRFFKFGPESSWEPHRVLMFSGGLASFAGAIEEIVEQKHRAALVSHASSTKIAPVQKRLISALSKRYGPDTCRQIPMTAQLNGRLTAERTHRTRDNTKITKSWIVLQFIPSNQRRRGQSGTKCAKCKAFGNSKT